MGETGNVSCLPSFRVKSSILYSKVCMPGSHLNVGLSTRAIITVLSVGTSVTHLSTKFLKSLEENTSSALHFTHQVFCEWHTSFVRLGILGWPRKCAGANSSLWEPVVYLHWCHVVAISDLGHSGSIYTPEIGKPYKPRIFFFPREPVFKHIPAHYKIYF